MSSLKKFKAERNKGIEALDMEYARKMLPMASSDLIRLMAMHKARYECKEIAADLRHESGSWLRKHGYLRIYGDALSPEGSLPE